MNDESPLKFAFYLFLALLVTVAISGALGYFWSWMHYGEKPPWP